MAPTPSFTCLHCDEPVINKNTFCCAGCETVYTLLKNNQLDSFYERKHIGDSFKPAPPVQQSNNTYVYFDLPETQSLYGSNNGLSMNFYVEGIHCHACIWLIEKLPSLVPDISSAIVNISEHSVTITRTPKGKFSNAGVMLDKLGYKLHIYDPTLKQNIQKNAHKKSLMRLGVSAACAANIMIFSISIYAGLESSLKLIFEWLSAGLMIPVLFYAAVPFFSSALSAIKYRVMNIDIPISAALVLGSSISIFNLLMGTGDVYFDSLAMFVFLVLSVRQLFNSSYQRLDIKKALTSTILPTETEKVTQSAPLKTMRIPTIMLKKSDVVIVEPHETIPVDGSLQTQAFIDMHMLTGESAPVKKIPGDDVLAGMKNTSSQIQVLVEKTGAQTKMGKLIQQINASKKPKMVHIADKIAHWFLIISLSLALGLFLFHGLVKHNINEGLQSALALIVLACPCAFSLATPLAYALSISNLAKKGACVQTASALEALANIKAIFFDKTGTLTTGQLEVSDINIISPIEHIWACVFTLESTSKHPIASAIKRYIHDNHPTAIQTAQNMNWGETKETFGVGVFGSIQNDTYKIVGSKEKSQNITTRVAMYKNDTHILDIYLTDTLNPDAQQTIDTLKTKYPITILSGDSDSCVTAVKNKLDIPNAKSRLSPKQKATIIKQTPHALMVGDGANDSLALHQASVSIAVQGSFESSLKAADIYLLTKNLAQIPKIIEQARLTKRIVFTNFALSLSYNGVGILLVVFGYVNPLIAAILMPISSLTVIVYSWSKLK